MGGEELGDEEPAEPSPEEGDLLAEPPAKRDDKDWKIKRKKDGKTTTSKSKGKWHDPVKHDQRYRAGLKSKMRSQYSYETGKATRRNTHKGIQDLLGLGRLSEREKTTYKEERKLFEVNKDIRTLITELESKNNEVEAQ